MQIFILYVTNIIYHARKCEATTPHMYPANQTSHTKPRNRSHFNLDKKSLDGTDLKWILSYKGKNGKVKYYANSGRCVEMYLMIA